MCNQGIRLHNPNTGNTASGRYRDTGPWFPPPGCSSCYDEYWKNGNQPKAEANYGQSRYTVCGAGCTDNTSDANRIISNKAIIDLHPTLRNALGANDNIPNVCWRFA
jgi:hypothetical protein